MCTDAGSQQFIHYGPSRAPTIIAFFEIIARRHRRRATILIDSLRAFIATVERIAARVPSIYRHAFFTFRKCDRSSKGERTVFNVARERPPPHEKSLRRYNTKIVLVNFSRTAYTRADSIIRSVCPGLIVSEEALPGDGGERDGNTSCPRRAEGCASSFGAAQVRRGLGKGWHGKKFTG